MNDILFENHGSVWLVQGISDAGRQWLDDHLVVESWQYLGRSIAVDPRYVEPIVEGAVEAGLGVSI